MTGMPWFRIYHEMLDDPKIGTLSDAEYRLWIELLCLACRAGKQGDTSLTIKDIEWQLRRESKGNVSETLHELLHRGLVELNTNGNGKETIFITKWKSRQYQSDSSTIRVRKHRVKSHETLR